MTALHLVWGALVGVAFVESIYRMPTHHVVSLLRVAVVAAALTIPSVLATPDGLLAVASFVVTKTLWLRKRGGVP